MKGAIQQLIFDKINHLKGLQSGTPCIGMEDAFESESVEIKAKLEVLRELAEEVRSIPNPKKK